MDWNHRVRSALLAGGRDPDADIVEELAQHARAMYEAARADGLSHEEADRSIDDQLERWRADAARLRRRAVRVAPLVPPAASAPTWRSGVARDLAYAARLLWRQPKFTLLATVTMALAIGSATTLFSVVHGVLMKPLPWADAERLVVLKETRGGHAPRFNSFSNAAYNAWRDHATTIAAIGAWAQQTVTLGGAGDPERLRIIAASASLFDVLDVRPILGTAFAEDAELPGRDDVVVLSEPLWWERFGGDRHVLGRVVQLDGRSHTIIGVLPANAAYPDRQSRAWVPFHVPSTAGNYLSMFEAIARLRPGVTAVQAAAEGTARGRFAADTGLTTTAIFGGTGPVTISATGVRAALTADVRPALLILMAAVMLLLVAGTANIAGLQLARATSRRREIAIRAAIGAGAGRIVRQLLAENLLLGACGGAAGLVLAVWLHRVLPALLPVDFPRVDDLRIDGTVVLFAVLVSVLTSVGFGLLPALGARRQDLVESLNADGTATAGVPRWSRAGRARFGIMAGQVAIACVLLVGASLLGRSFVGLVTADRGYDPSGVLIARVSLPASMYSPERRYVILHSILDRLGAIAGAADAAFTSELPLTPGGSTSAFTLRRPGGTLLVQASPRIVSPRCFPALGMRIVEGRGFSEADTQGSAPVTIVNRAFARRYLDGVALGTSCRWEPDTAATASKPPSSASWTMCATSRQAIRRSPRSITRSLSSRAAFRCPW
ncbi:MAG: putative transport system permease protein [Acidobacteriota bacterium]|jgi:predicted permease